MIRDLVCRMKQHGNFIDCIYFIVEVYKHNAEKQITSSKIKH